MVADKMKNISFYLVFFGEKIYFSKKSVGRFKIYCLALADHYPERFL